MDEGGESLLGAKNNVSTDLGMLAVKTHVFQRSGSRGDRIRGSVDCNRDGQPGKCHPPEYQTVLLQLHDAISKSCMPWI